MEVTSSVKCLILLSLVTLAHTYRPSYLNSTYFGIHVGIVSDVTGCSGAVVHKNYVVTPAHCVQRTISGNSHAMKKLLVDPGSGQTYEVEKVVIHENYYREDSINDMAILKLKKPIEGARPLTLPHTKPTRLSKCRFIGLKEGFQKDQFELTSTSLRIGIGIRCRIYSLLAITDQNICAHVFRNQQNVCRALSGSLLLKQQTLIGLGSTLHGCRMGITFISIEPFTSWIKLKIESLEHESEHSTPSPPYENTTIPHNTTTTPHQTTATPHQTTATPHKTTTTHIQTNTTPLQTNTASPQTVTTSPQTPTTPYKTTTTHLQTTTTPHQTTATPHKTTTTHLQTNTTPLQTNTASPQTATTSPQTATTSPQTPTTHLQTTTTPHHTTATPHQTTTTHLQTNTTPLQTPTTSLQTPTTPYKTTTQHLQTTTTPYKTTATPYKTTTTPYKTTTIHLQTTTTHLQSTTKELPFTPVSAARSVTSSYSQGLYGTARYSTNSRDANHEKKQKTSHDNSTIGNETQSPHGTSNKPSKDKSSQQSDTAQHTTNSSSLQTSEIDEKPSTPMPVSQPKETQSENERQQTTTETTTQQVSSIKSTQHNVTPDDLVTGTIQHNNVSTNSQDSPVTTSKLPGRGKPPTHSTQKEQ